MNRIGKIVVAVLLAAGVLQAQAQETPVPAGATEGAGRFDVSIDACYQRLQRLQDIRARQFQPAGDMAERVLRHAGDDTVFGIPKDDWTPEVQEEFYTSLDLCTRPGLQNEGWGSEFVSDVRAGFPGYLAMTKSELALGERYTARTAGPSGLTISCKELAEYPDRSGSQTAPQFSPQDGSFGKDFRRFDDDDYVLLHKKVDECASLLTSLARASQWNADDSIDRLRHLQRAIGTDWKKEQATAIAAQASQDEVKTAHVAEAAEAERRATNPTLFERIGNFMWKIGLVFFAIAVVLTPKSDRRYKTGFRGNAVIQPFVKKIYAGATGLIVIGASIAQPWS